MSANGRTVVPFQLLLGLGMCPFDKDELANLIAISIDLSFRMPFAIVMGIQMGCGIGSYSFWLL